MCTQRSLSESPDLLLKRAKNGYKLDNDLQIALFYSILTRDKTPILCDLLSHPMTNVLKVYINQDEFRFDAPNQTGGTCYANATATTLHLAMHRIIGRVGGYPEFKDLRKQIIGMYGKNGANLNKVLMEICPKYRLNVREVNLSNAISAVQCNRPVVASFHLNGTKWDAFSYFYKKNPRGVLTKEDLNKQIGPLRPEESGHAVVLLGLKSHYLMFMNSWGESWGDKGYFRVSLKGNILNCKFYDVYWTLNDLKRSEIQAYEHFKGKPEEDATFRSFQLDVPFSECKYLKLKK